MRCPAAFVVALSLCMHFQPALGHSDQRHGQQMASYRRTSHSLAITVPFVPGVERLNTWRGRSPKAGEWLTQADKLTETHVALGQPWWWLVAVRSVEEKAPTPASLPWDRLVERFKRKMSREEDMALEEVLARNGSSTDGVGVFDPKARTVNLDGKSEVFFHAVPQGRCNNQTRPPRIALLPRVLPPVAHGECVLELCGLSPNTAYKLMLFNISNGSSPPKAEEAERSVALADAATARAPLAREWIPWSMKVACALAMVLAVGRHVWEECSRPQAPMRYSQVGLVAPALGEEGMGGNQLVKVTNLSVENFKDMCIALTMFLPIIGPLGLVLTSHVVIGTRIRKVLNSYRAYVEAEEYKVDQLFRFIEDIITLIISVVIIPFNIFAVQTMWATYCTTWSREIGFDLTGDTSFSSLQKYGDDWRELSGVELGGWVPGVILSNFILALELRNDAISAILQKHRKRVEAQLSAMPKGRELWSKLCKMDSRMFGMAEEEPDKLMHRLCRLILCIIFGLLPHLWMCARRKVPLWNGNLMSVTLVYVIIIAGVSTQFLELSTRIQNSYRSSCKELATFQALSWEEDTSTAIYDPFATRNEAVIEARRRLRENIPKISRLKLEEPEDSKVWWLLRELVFIQIQDGRIMMEMMVLFSICLALLLGGTSLAVMISLKEMTAITLVTGLVMVVLSRFTYTVLGLARDINLMSSEHTCLLHNIVAEMNMPLRPSRPLDSHLQQERFLLQVATLIEKQPAPETVGSFAVTPQLFSLVLGILGLLTAVSLYNLVNGIITLTH